MTYQEAYAKFEEDLRNAQTGKAGSSTKTRGRHFIQSELTGSGLRSYEINTKDFTVQAIILTNENGCMVRETFTIDVYASEVRNYSNSSTVRLKAA